ncbi:MAG TPA: sugar ABC transporter ATP-binding protein [Devosia sp.]|nr:sugar ABC transporter ATP-binding protein [Devosia sp.]
MQAAQQSADTATAAPAVAEARSVSKRFGPTTALDNVSLAVRAGQSHALVGRNGAGKSTLVAIMTGMTPPDEGQILFGGIPAPSLSNRDAWRQNVACVYQRSTIIPALTVAENLFINRQSTGSLISWPALNRRASTLLEEYGVSIDASRAAGELDVESRQMVEIARALSMGARFIILDEPTAQLDGAASERLFSRMRTLQAGGVTFLFISHHLHEIYEVCETVTVLRDARHIATRPASELSRDELVEAMTGEARRSASVWSRPALAGEVRPILEVEDLSLTGHYIGIDLAVRPGEVVGIAGSGSSGSTALGQSLFGMRRADNGTIRIRGKAIPSGSIPDALDAGIGCVPKDRQKEGIVPLLSVGENVTMPITDRLGRFGAINMARRDRFTSNMIERLDIKTEGPQQLASALSGGNQQKIVMGRALSNDPEVLILIDPTAGVDVKSKESLLGAVDKSARDGRAVVMISDDLDDLRCCDRVVVMFRGTIAREFAAGWAEADVIGAMEGMGIERQH